MENFLQYSIYGIEIYYIISFILVGITYFIYSWIKINKVKYIRISMLVLAITYTALLIIIIKNNINIDKIKSTIWALIIVTTVMFFKSKNDIRGDKVATIINKQKLWRKKKYYFYAKDFNEIELRQIEFVLIDFFEKFNDNNYDEKIGDLFIWITKKQEKVNIKLINKLDYFCDRYYDDIVGVYREFSQENQFEENKLLITGKRDKDIQLEVKFSSY